MCGRITMAYTMDAVTEYLYRNYHIGDFASHTEIALPRYNVAPGQQLIAVINDGKEFRAGLLKWGFVPFFQKSEKAGYNMINAKAETVAQKPAFRTALKTNRCIILADGFYEWKKENDRKIPMRFLLEDRRIFGFAGLWSTMTCEDGSRLSTCTIITTVANLLLAPVHDRMPVILSPEHERLWLDPKITDPDLLLSVLLPFDPKKMVAYPVSPKINNAHFDDPSCINSIEMSNHR